MLPVVTHMDVDVRHILFANLLGSCLILGTMALNFFSASVRSTSPKIVLAVLSNVTEAYFHAMYAYGGGNIEKYIHWIASKNVRVLGI